MATAVNIIRSVLVKRANVTALAQNITSATQNTTGVGKRGMVYNVAAEASNALVNCDLFIFDSDTPGATVAASKLIKHLRFAVDKIRATGVSSGSPETMFAYYDSDADSTELHWAVRHDNLTASDIHVSFVLENASALKN